MAVRQQLFDLISDLDESSLTLLKPHLERSLLILNWRKVDMSGVFPDDAILSVASFLEVRDLVGWQSCNSGMLNIIDHMWRDIGISMFPNVYVDGRRFDGVPVSDDSCTSWYARYLLFHRSMRICMRDNVTSLVGPRRVVTCVPSPLRISCTIPSKFSVSLHGSTYIEMTVGIKFSPDAVRSVIGLIDVPVVPLGSNGMDCDRGLSRKHWGLAFGPLTGVVSTQGRYFDNFRTYRARHGLKDYLSMALWELIEVRVGIFIHEGKVAFYRLPENDYCDWECTGFVYDCLDTIVHKELLLVSQVYPSLMFSNIGREDTISVSVDRISTSPPYYPHTNTLGLNFNSWSWFAEAASLESESHNNPVHNPLVLARAVPRLRTEPIQAIVPPNSPIPSSFQMLHY